jgi:preprotein translocase SecE subunit
VARDRQRAKQRQRRNRQPGSGGPAAGSARARARDSDSPPALEPTDADLGSTPPPEPTEHAFPDAEQARMAEAGVEPEAEPELAAEPDPEAEPELGADLEPEDVQATDPAVLEERQAARRPRKQRGRIITFLGHVIDELRRVQWPDRRQTGQGTAVTLGFVVVAGGFLGLMDAIWKPLVDAIL